VNFYSCSHQQETAAALRQRRWPEACTQELRTHVEACLRCKELVLVTHTLQHARQEAMPMAQLVPPGLLWWRAQLRLQNALAERVAKPVGLVEKLALAITLLLAGGWAIGQRAEMADWLHWFAEPPYGSVLRLDVLWSAGDGITWALLVTSATMLCVLGGLAVYLFASSK
jgi:hypothetical protein